MIYVRIYTYTYKNMYIFVYIYTLNIPYMLFIVYRGGCEYILHMYVHTCICIFADYTVCAVHRV